MHLRTHAALEAETVLEETRIGEDGPIRSIEMQRRGYGQTSEASLLVARRRDTIDPYHDSRALGTLSNTGRRRDSSGKPKAVAL